MGYLGGPGSCPPGFYWDALTSTCQSVIGVIGPLDCPPGYYYDAINGACVPFGSAYPPPAGITWPTPTKPRPAPPQKGIVPPPLPKPGSPPSFIQSTPPTGTAPQFPPTGPVNVYLPPIFGGSGPSVTSTTTSGTTVIPGGIVGGPTIVNVTQAVSLADNSASNAVQSVADAVYAALQQAAGLSGNAIGSAVSTIGQQLADLGASITQGVSGAYGVLENVIGGIEGSISQTLGGIGTTIGNQIFASVNPVVGALSDIVRVISGQIGGLAGAIASAVANVIPAIVGAVTGSLSPIQATLTSLEGILSDKLGELVTSSGAIATSIGGIGTTLDTVLLHYQSWFERFTEQSTGYGTGETLHKDFSALAEALGGLIANVPVDVTVRASDWLTSSCPTPDLKEAFLKAWNDEKTPSSFWNWGAVILSNLALAIYSIRPFFDKYAEEAQQRINAGCQLGLLPPNQLVEAVQRGFIPYDQAQLEAQKQDIDPSRFRILSDLARELLNPSQLVAAKYRGIITDADFTVALEQQGFTDQQIQALQALGVSLLSLTQLFELRQRQQIDDDALKRSLAAHQYDETQQAALASLVFRPLNVSEAIDGQASQDALLQLGLGAAANPDTIPEFVSVAGQNEGLDGETTAARWFAHWNVGSVASYITLYFRGLIPLETLQAVMAKNYIPPNLVSTLVEAQRPIVQYRTISNMLRIGQIDVQTAGRLLQQHGYSPENAQLLITYAQRPGASAAAKKAAAIHAVSLAIAKREYIDGAISENDYYQILLAHGYTVEGADAEIAVEKANQGMLVRKENAQLVVDEYGSGLIDEQTALAQLAILGLTVYELAKYTHKIRVFRVKRGKQPTEAELNDFRKNHVITDAQYTQQLVLIGYSPQVSNWFVQWRTLPTVAPPTPVAPATTPPGG